MKRYYILAMMAAASVAALAQDYTDAERFSRIESYGSARSQAMGGAFGALGADFTSAQINPAGIGVYRASEIGMTLGVNTNNIVTKTPRDLGPREDRGTYVSGNQFGVVFSSQRIRQESGIAGHSFALSYTKTADYDRMFTLRNRNMKNSLMDFFIGDDRAQNAYEADLAWDAEMLFGSYFDTDPETGDEYEVVIDHNGWEYPYESDDLSEILFDNGMRVNSDNTGKIDGRRHFKDKGSKGQISFAYSQNIANKVYWGINMGVETYSFKRELTHDEFYNGTPEYECPDNFRYTANLKQDGTGINFGAGVIYLPMPALRLGVAVHSPTFIKINEDYETSFQAGNEATQWSPFSEVEYKFTAPARMVLSAAGVFGTLGILSVDYELMGYSSAKFRNSDEPGEDDFYDQLNSGLKDSFKNVHKLRIGAEIKPISMLALRAGYSTQTTPYKNHILSYDYQNRSITAGVGLRFNNFFVDFSYVNNKQQDEQWLLPDSGSYIYEDVKMGSSVEKTSHNVSVSVGYRF